MLEFHANLVSRAIKHRPMERIPFGNALTNIFRSAILHEGQKWPGTAPRLLLTHWFIPSQPSRNSLLMRPERRNTIPNTKTAGRPTSSESQPTHWGTAILAKRSGTSADAIQIADATIAVWYDIATALTSIIGRHGVAALYDRSIALTAPTYPWLASSRAGDDHSVDLDGLQAVIAQQSNDDAAAGSGELLQTFYDVLVSLIGPALCEQLLTSVREDFASPRSRDL
jgi:hypothetical protein